VIGPDATFNPYHNKDAKVDSLMKTIQTGSVAQADAAAKQLNTYVVDQAWFDPWYRNQGNMAADSSTNVVPQRDNAYAYLWNITPK
jgi:peptide/nickel transport system substrate-binding protein